jgi:hypothetical protein
MSAPVTFRVVKRDGVVTCECGHKITARAANGAFEVSPHLRESHGFVGEIDFEKVSEVICPPMITMRASIRRAV